MNLLNRYIKYIYEKAAWRGDNIANTTYDYGSDSSTWGTNALLLKENDLVTSLPPASSSLTLQYKLTKSSLLSLNPLLAAHLKGKIYPFLRCVPFSAPLQISPHLHPITIQFSRFFYLLLAFLFSDHSSVSFVGFSPSTIAPHGLILSHFLTLHPLSWQFYPPQQCQISAFTQLFPKSL